MKTLKNKNAIQGKSRAGTLDIRSDKLMLMRLSGDKNSLGKIVDVNFEFCQQLKYEKADIVGSHIRKMLPQMVAECHDDWILSSYETQKFSRLNVISNGFLRDKCGYFHYAIAIVKEIPNLKEGLNFLAALELNKKMTGYTKVQDERGVPCMFICDRNRKIVGINEEVTRVFKVTPSNIERDQEMNIEKLFPFLSDYNMAEAAKSKDGAKAEILLNQYKELNLDNEFMEQADQGEIS